MTRYYSTQRPFGPGTFPRKDGRETVTNYAWPTFCEEIGREAWGHVEYPEPLTEKEAAEYELTIAGMKLYYCVTSSFDDQGKAVAAITNVIEAVQKPENSSRSTKRKDIYNDWFKDPEEAKKYVEDVRKA